MLTKNGSKRPPRERFRPRRRAGGARRRPGCNSRRGRRGRPVPGLGEKTPPLAWSAMVAAREVMTVRGKRMRCGGVEVGRHLVDRRADGDQRHRGGEPAGDAGAEAGGGVGGEALQNRSQQAVG